MKSQQVNKQKDVGYTAKEPEPTMLQKAHAIIYGDREDTYGNPGKNLKVIAEFWSVHLTAKFGEPVEISINDVCGMMVLLKQARLINSPDHLESEIDVCGYTALRERVRTCS